MVELLAIVVGILFAMLFAALFYVADYVVGGHSRYECPANVSQKDSRNRERQSEQPANEGVDT